MNDAEIIYTELWDKSMRVFDRGRCEIDSQINNPSDLRRGLTLRAKLSPEVISQIQEFTSTIKNLLPTQYFTPISNLHLTVLTVISCTHDFHYNSALDDAYCEIIMKCMENLTPPSITFNGITASPSCLLLRGYQEDRSLWELRRRLREQFRKSSLPNSVDLRYPLKTAHTTLMRFVNEPDNMAEFTAFIKENKNHFFGRQMVNEIEFVTNDWCHKFHNTKIIKTLEIKNEGSVALGDREAPGKLGNV
ncbi:MAG: hypothetical protein V5783_04715 [Pontiella sp.]